MRARALKWLLLDVDGVLTDGRIWFDAKGETMKVFDVRDGLGIKLLTGAGIEVGILSARTNPIVEKRGRELGLSEILQGRENKLDSFRDFLVPPRTRRQRGRLSRRRPARPGGTRRLRPLGGAPGRRARSAQPRALRDRGAWRPRRRARAR